MLDRFMQYIAAQHLVPPGSKVLLAVSGGRDSVCMAHLFHCARIPFAIAHCNFNLRPGDCDRDQDFVRQLAEEYGVEFFTTSFDTKDHANRYRLSIEEAARNLRYGFFSSICSKHGYQRLATAHHRNDAIETLFLNLFRGTGISGLHGIRPLSEIFDITVIRPMLCFSRPDIDDYVIRHRLSYVDDYTNDSLDYRRNRIRLQLMPLVRELYPSADATLMADMNRFAQVEQIYDKAVSEVKERVGHSEQSPFGFWYKWYDLDELRNLSPRDTLVFEILRPYGFSLATIANIIGALSSPQTGTRFFGSGYMALIDRDRLVVTGSLAPPSAPVVDVSPVAMSQLPNLGAPKDRGVEYIDADSVQLPLSVRRWKSGDRFCPLGLSHHRLVSDLLKDCKLNLIEKQHIHLLVDALGRIVWVVGLRLDNRFRLTRNTRRALRLEVTDWGNA